MFKTIQIIANPAAGQDQPVLATMNRIFREHGIDWDFRITHRYGDGARLAREACAAGVDLIVAYGGDGTLMDVANGIYPTDVPLAALVGGTGNGTARALGVPVRLDRAIEQIATGAGTVEAYDAGQIADTLFLLSVIVSPMVERIQQQTREDKDRLGGLAYVMVVAQTLVNPRETEYRITVDGETVETRAAACVVMNWSTFGAYNIGLGDRVKPTDGKFDLFILRHNALEAVKFVASLTDFVDFDRTFPHYQGSRIRIETADTMPVLVDGDDIEETPLDIKLLPRAVRLFTPARV